MTTKVLSVSLFFVASIFVGRSLINTETVQAQPVYPSYLELLSMTSPKVEEKLSVGIDTIEVSYNVNTQEVSVKGTADAIVNVTTTGEMKPIVKYKTVVKEVNTGYPFVSSLGRMDGKPISPFTKLYVHE